MYSGTSKPRNYSTRNSLRSAQDDNSQPSDDSQQNIESLLNMFQNKPTIQPQDLKASYMNALGFSDVSNYVALNSDSFIRTIGSFYYCLLCGKRARFEREATITSHVENKLHINKLLQLRAYLFSKLPDDNSLNMKALSKFLDRWYEENALTDVMSTLRQYVVEEFNEILQSINPQCYCRLTGSLLTGTSLRYSDINLELIHPNSKLFESDSRAKNSIHHKLIDPDAGVGQQFNNHTIHFDLIANAIETLYKTAGYIQLGYTATNSFCVSSSIQDLTNKVPRLILTHRETNIELEISCYSDSSYKLNSLLRLYLSLDERSRVLSTLVKHWAKICHISEPERGTYAPTTFIILVIYYLQRVSPPILPCLHDLLPQKMKDNQNDKSLIKQLNELNLSDLEEHELKSCDKPNSLVEDSNLHEASLEQLNESEGEDEEGEDEPEAEAEDDNFELNEETVKNLNWKSENHSSIHRLFAGFMMFMIDEFDDTSRVISIRTLKDVTLISKKWNTQVKAIENPLKPKTNLSRTIGAFRTFEYLRQCFKNAFHYLTSIPVQAALRQADPRDYIEFYVNVGRLDFFFEMKEAMRAFPLNNCVADMIRQNLFARDVEVINSVVESCLTRGMDLELLPTSLANYYSSHFLVPLDNAATHFCWLCRRFGHKKPDCPKIHIEKLAQELQFYDHQLDRIVQFDGDFLKLYERDLITPEVARMHQSIVNKLRDTIAEMTGLDCKLELFGSTVNLLGSCDSDLDICMTLKDNPTGKGLNFVKILRQVHEVLIAMQEVMSIEPILSARVPIIRFRYKNFDVDLSMYNQCAIYNSKLLRTYVLIDYRVAQLFYLVKRFAKVGLSLLMQKAFRFESPLIFTISHLYCRAVVSLTPREVVYLLTLGV